MPLVARESKISGRNQDAAQVLVPFYSNPNLEGIALRQKPFVLADDRKAAKNYVNVMRKKKTKKEEHEKTKSKREGKQTKTMDDGNKKGESEKVEDDELGQPYPLHPLGEMVLDGAYGQEVPRNYLPFVGRALGMQFLYKIYYRVDQLTRYEKLKQVTYYVKRYFREGYNTGIDKDNCLDWIHTAPLLAQLIRSRGDPCLRVSLAPKTYDCRGILQSFNRRSMAVFFKHESGFSPLAFGLNAVKIQKTMSSRWLYKLFIAYKEKTAELVEDVKAFLAENQKWKNFTKELTRPPLILPPSFRPYRPGVASNYPGLLTGHYSILLSELNQLPSALLLDYNICRVRHPLTIEIATFGPRRLSRKNALTKEKSCDSNEFCFKVISDAREVEEHLGAVKIRRSVYSNEAANTTTLTEIGKEQDEDGNPTADGLCDSDSMESLASLSGWSTDSFASTATLSPGDASYNWQILSKEMCASYQTSETVQNPRKWAYLAKLDQSARIAREMDERLLLANGDDGKTIYNYMRNPFFKKTAASVRERNVRRKEDYKKVKTTWGQLKGRVEAVKEDGKKDVVAESLLETALRRAQRFEKVVERDRYKGLDISPAWMAAIDAKLISEESMERLSHLISSRDSWVTTSPLTDRAMAVRCDQLQLGPRAPLPILGGAIDYLLAIVLLIILVLVLIYG